MFGLHKGRRGYVLVLAGLMSVAAIDPAWTQGEALQPEKGIGGANDAAAPETRALPSDAVAPKSGEGMIIIMDDDQPPVIKFAGSSNDEQRRTRDRSPNLLRSSVPAEKAVSANDLLSIKHDVLAQYSTERTRSTQPAQDVANSVIKLNAGDVRLTPPTAVDLLGGRQKKMDPETAVAALPTTNMPVASTTKTTAPAKTEVQQAQFAPNAIAGPKAVVSPRAGDQAERPHRPEPVFLPSPRKPRPPAPVIEQAVLSPNVAKSPKTALLRTAPSPDNKLVELVETPSDQALHLSVGRGQLLNLGTSVTDVFVADPNIADVRVVSQKKLFVHGNTLGRTNIFGISASGDVVFGIDLQVVPDAKAAQAQLQAAAPNSKANIQLVSDKLVAEGMVNDVGEAMQVAALSEQLTATEGPTANNTVISGSQQVNLRVRFAEVSRDDVVNLGVNWNALGNTGDFLIGLSNGPDIGDLAGLANDLAGDPSTSGGIPGTGDINVEAFIDALHQEGIITLLAEPNLTAINGETGEFLAGSEVPIPIPGPDGKTYIDYKQVGVSLEYIPTLLPGNRINLRLRPEVSSPSPTGGVIIDGFSIPAFTVRRTETSVELTSGQTMALAGLFQRDISTDINKFPILGDLPILGKLFRSERYQ
ncbi:MAG: type II and III secretion system protein family protein, partial [Geminicoccaceae bacterium]